MFLSIELECFQFPSVLPMLSPQYEKLTNQNSTIKINLKPLMRALKSIFTSSTTLLFGLPAFAYFINNNLSFIILTIMNPPTFTVLGNLKILTTGLFSHIFLNRKLIRVQWASLCLLFLGTTVAQIHFTNDGAFEFSVSPLGFLLIIIFASISAGASVYTEFVMKDKFGQESMHLQNIKLYLFGILFNGGVYHFNSFYSDGLYELDEDDSDAVVVKGKTFFSSLYLIHFLIIGAACSMGLITSAIIKFSGSITKVYANSMAMFFSSFVSYFFIDGYRPTIWFFLGAMTCCIAVQMYTNGVNNGGHNGSNKSGGKDGESSNNHNSSDADFVCNIKAASGSSNDYLIRKNNENKLNEKD
nr:2657_t:CDS:1 [Entrophospora candida]CAG8663167.1 2437_t:CDS:1 [Entrophospora candida]